MGRQRSWVSATVTVAGFLLLFVTLYFYLLSGLVVPPPAVAVLLIIWGGLFALAVKWRHQPKRVFALPFIAAAIWYAIVQGGSWIFGWTA